MRNLNFQSNILLADFMEYIFFIMVPTHLHEDQQFVVQVRLYHPTLIMN